MIFKKKKKQGGGKGEKSLRLARQFIFTEVPLPAVAPEIAAWGESAWWPPACPMRFQRITEGEIGVGTRYRQRVKGALIPSWISEISEFSPNTLVKRTFVKGPFEGYEIVRMGERANGTRIDYELHYRVKGVLNRILWSLFYRKKHDRNVRLVLDALSDYVSKKDLKEGIPPE